MADEQTQWQFQLIDGISGAAAKMQASVAALQAQMQRTEAAFKTANTGTQKSTESAYDAMKNSVKSFAEGFFFVTEDIERGADFVIGVFDRLKDLGAKVFDIAEFRRNALIGLDAMLSTGFEASDVLEKLEGWAKQTGLAKDTFVQFGKQLLGEGFREGELKPLLAALSDVQAVNGGKVEASQRLLEIFGKIRATDKVNARELAQFGELGIRPDRIYEAYAKAGHTTIEAAKAAFQGGDVAGGKALQAIVDSISAGIDKGGPLGARGQTFELGSVPAQWQKLKDAVTSVFEGVDAKPFALALTHITEQFSADKAQRFGDAISSAFARVGEWLAHLDVSQVGASIDKIAGVIEFLIDTGRTFFAGFRQGWNDMSPAISGMGSLLASVFGTGGGATDSLKLFAESIANVVGALVLLGEGVLFVAGLIGQGFIAVVEGAMWLVTDLPTKIGGALSSGFEAFVAFGKGIVDGLWQGITGAWSGMIAQFHGLLEELPAGVRKILGIQSPSRVFAGLGVYAMEGFSQGIASVNVYQDVLHQVAPPRGSDVMRIADVGFQPNSRSLADFAPTGGGGGRAQVSVDIQAPIHIDGSKESHATAEATVGEMRRVLIPELTTALEQLLIETGG